MRSAFLNEHTIFNNCFLVSSDSHDFVDIRKITAFNLYIQTYYINHHEETSDYDPVPVEYYYVHCDTIANKRYVLSVFDTRKAAEIEILILIDQVMIKTR